MGDPALKTTAAGIVVANKERESAVGANAMEQTPASQHHMQAPVLRTVSKGPLWLKAVADH